jgi:hypothetical protein
MRNLIKEEMACSVSFFIFNVIVIILIILFIFIVPHGRDPESIGINLLLLIYSIPLLNIFQSVFTLFTGLKSQISEQSTVARLVFSKQGVSKILVPGIILIACISLTNRFGFVWAAMIILLAYLGLKARKSKHEDSARIVPWMHGIIKLLTPGIWIGIYLSIMCLIFSFVVMSNTARGERYPLIPHFLGLSLWFLTIYVIQLLSEVRGQVIVGIFCLIVAVAYLFPTSHAVFQQLGFILGEAQNPEKLAPALLIIRYLWGIILIIWGVILIPYLFMSHSRKMTLVSNGT